MELIRHTPWSLREFTRDHPNLIDCDVYSQNSYRCVLSRLLCRTTSLLIIANRTTLRHVADLPYRSEPYSSESFASSLGDDHKLLLSSVNQ